MRRNITVPEDSRLYQGLTLVFQIRAYQNYRYGEALNANASAIILARKHIYEMLDKQVEENKRSIYRNQLQEDIAQDTLNFKEYTDPFTGEPVK